MNVLDGTSVFVFQVFMPSWFGVQIYVALKRKQHTCTSLSMFHSRTDLISSVSWSLKREGVGGEEEDGERERMALP